MPFRDAVDNLVCNYCSRTCHSPVPEAMCGSDCPRNCGGVLVRRIQPQKKCRFWLEKIGNGTVKLKMLSNGYIFSIFRIQRDGSLSLYSGISGGNGISTDPEGAISVDEGPLF